MIVGVTGWRGTGITTAALVLAACLGEQGTTWLVEADPAGGALAGRIHLDPAHIGGLERIAFPTDDVPLPEAFAERAAAVGDIRLVTAPADPFRAHACHQPRAPWPHALHELEGSVVVDAGRSRAGSPAHALLELADVVVLVTSPEVSAAVASFEWCRAAGRVSPLDPGLDAVTVRVVAVDGPAGVAFDVGDLKDEFADEWGGWFPWEPSTVDLLHRGATAGDRRLRTSALLAAARRLARDLQPSTVAA